MSEPLDKIQQYRISYNDNTMVFYDQFRREGHLWPDNFPRNRGKLHGCPNSIKHKY